MGFSSRVSVRHTQALSGLLGATAAAPAAAAAAAGSPFGASKSGFGGPGAMVEKDNAAAVKANMDSHGSLKFVFRDVEICFP